MLSRITCVELVMLTPTCYSQHLGDGNGEIRGVQG